MRAAAMLVVAARFVGPASAGRFVGLATAGQFVGPASAGQRVADDHQPPEGGPTVKPAASVGVDPVSVNGCATP
jgi:hypothetical protein